MEEGTPAVAIPESKPAFATSMWVKLKQYAPHCFLLGRDVKAFGVDKFSQINPD